MSSFSTLNTALTALNAQRQAIAITGQNLANVNTDGYTRQRVSMSAIPSSSPATLAHGASITSGGVVATSVERLGDTFLEMRLRQTTSSASALSEVGSAWSALETSLHEPSDGLSKTLGAFFDAWQDLSNSPDSTPVRSVLLEQAGTLTSSLAEAYGTVEAQWETARAKADTTATAVNTAAAQVADLNRQITAVTVSGGSANELIDARAALLTQLSGLVGAEAKDRADGTVDVMIGGNALVRGSASSEVEVRGTTDFSDISGLSDPSAAADPVRLVWSADPARVVEVPGGTLGGILEVVSADGPLASLAQTYNALAEDLASTAAGSINALHSSAYTASGAQGGAFFTLDGAEPDAPAVKRLALAIASADGIAAAADDGGGSGSKDGSAADAISQIATSTDLWSAAVATIGVQSARAQSLASTSETSRASAQEQLLAGTSVDESEETTNLIAYQRAFQAAARLTTVVDDLLDTLINRMAL
jgi:flagellar hook-associated protein 1 FlgK